MQMKSHASVSIIIISNRKESLYSSYSFYRQSDISKRHHIWAHLIGSFICSSLVTLLLLIRLNISKIGRLAPSYLRLQFFGWPLGGASIAVGIDYVNEFVRRFPNVRQAAAVELHCFRKALGGLKLFHL